MRANELYLQNDQELRSQSQQRKKRNVNIFISFFIIASIEIDEFVCNGNRFPLSIVLIECGCLAGTICLVLYVGIELPSQRQIQIVSVCSSRINFRKTICDLSTQRKYKTSNRSMLESDKWRMKL